MHSEKCRWLAVILKAMPILFLLFALDAHAEISNAGLFDTIVDKFKGQAATWGDTFKNYASWLFLALATISMVWTFGILALRKADLGEFFSEFVRFFLFFGFYWWLLQNGPEFASSIIQSMAKIGGDINSRNGFATALSPSGIVDIGFSVVAASIKSISALNLSLSLMGIILALGVLLVTILIAVNMVLLLISAWVLSYAGIFFLGFGGSRWTSEIAIHYYKTVLGTAAQIMTMMLLVGIGSSIMVDYYEQGGFLSKPNTMSFAVMFTVAVVMYMLVDKIPQLVSGIITGSSITGGGIGQLGGTTAISNAWAAGKLTQQAAGSQAGKAFTDAIKMAATGAASGGMAVAAKTATSAALGVAQKAAGSIKGKAQSSTSTPFGKAAGFDDKR